MVSRAIQIAAIQEKPVRHTCLQTCQLWPRLLLHDLNLLSVMKFWSKRPKKKLLTTTFMIKSLNRHWERKSAFPLRNQFSYEGMVTISAFAQLHRK